jgi:hypothetical protein
MRNGKTSNSHNVSCLASFACSKVGLVSGGQYLKTPVLTLSAMIVFVLTQFVIVGVVRANKFF